MQISTFFDFCSGIGGGRLGLEQAGNAINVIKAMGESIKSFLMEN